MLMSELIEKLQKLMEQYGDAKVVTFDLDRTECDVAEIDYDDNLEDPSVFIG